MKCPSVLDIIIFVCVDPSRNSKNAVFENDGALNKLFCRHRSNLKMEGYINH